MHETIGKGPGIFDSHQPKRTRGIARFVYWNIHTVTSLVGGGVDSVLSQLDSTLPESEVSPRREAVRSVINGVFGDHLAAKGNPLAIPMQIYRNGAPLGDEALCEAIQDANGRVSILVHGSCMNDLQWNRQGHDHGAALKRDLNIAPLYVHYNTGRHTSENGRDLTNLLQTISDQSPCSLSLNIVAYSMGGLVARSACHYGQQSGHRWLNQLESIIFLGTPHHGAPLEKGGVWVNFLLETSPYSAPFSRLGKIRSAGITDLRYGNVVDEDWHGRDRFKVNGDQRKPVPLPQGIACYTIAASTGTNITHLGDQLIGDGLVPVDSALGKHPDPSLTLDFPETHQWLGRDMSHMDLLSDPAVYATIKQWLELEEPIES